MRSDPPQSLRGASSREKIPQGEILWMERYTSISCIYIYNLYITGYISGHMLGGRPLSLVHKTFRMLWWLLIWCFRNYFLHIPDITTAFQIGKIPASTKSSQTDLTTLKFSSVGWWELPMKNSASVLGGKKKVSTKPSSLRMEWLLSTYLFILIFFYQKVD